MRRLKSILRSKAGGMYVDSAFFIWLAVAATALVLSVFAVSWGKTSSQNFADYAARQISADGSFSADTVKKLAKVAGSGHFEMEVKADDGYDATVPVGSSSSCAEADFPLGTSFTVRIVPQDSYRIGIGGIKTVAAVVGGAADGVTTRYWKG